MAEPTVPPTPPSGPDRPMGTPPPVTPPPPGGGAPWGKIALFGCLGLFIIGILLSVAGYFIWSKMKERDELTEQYIEERQGDGGVISGEADGGPQVVDGTLDSSDRVRDDGSYYDEHTVQLSSGSNLVVTMRSTDFDAYLTLYSPSGATFSDDDGGGGTDARVQVTVTETGPWRIWANTLLANTTGSYTLTIER
jgi:hypothetical protein